MIKAAQELLGAHNDQTDGVTDFEFDAITTATGPLERNHHLTVAPLLLADLLTIRLVLLPTYLGCFTSSFRLIRRQTLLK